MRCPRLWQGVFGAWASKLNLLILIVALPLLVQWFSKLSKHQNHLEVF